jgi:hypothetical protein
MPGLYTGFTPHNNRHRLDRVPGKLCPKMLAPAHIEATVRRLQRRDVKPTTCQQRYPRSIGAELRPTPAAECKHHRIGSDRAVTLWRGKTQSPLLVPAGPPMTHVESHAGLAQPAEPRAQQRCGLEIGGKHSPGRAHKCFDAESTGPGPERVRPERRKQRRDLRAPCPIAREKFLRRFRVCEIQAAFPGQEELATDRRHGVIEIDLCAGGTRHLRGHEPGRSSADNGNVHLFPNV